jgi:hypothetical protein
VSLDVHARLMNPYGLDGVAEVWRRREFVVAADLVRRSEVRRVMHAS